MQNDISIVNNTTHYALRTALRS